MTLETDVLVFSVFGTVLLGYYLWNNWHYCRPSVQEELIEEDEYPYQPLPVITGDLQKMAEENLSYSNTSPV